MPLSTSRSVIRAVAATEFWYGATGLDMVNGLRSLDWDVQQVNIRNFFNTTSGFMSRVARRAVRSTASRYYNSAIRRAISDSNAQVLFTVKGAEIDSETLRWCADHGVIKTIFYPDVAFNHTGVDEEQFGNYDLVITTKSYHVNYMKNQIGAEKVHHIPHGYSDMIYRDIPPVEERDYRWDFAYVGNASRHKFDYLLEVKLQMPELTMIIVGSGWKQMAEGTALATDVIGYSLTGDHLAAISRLSRINLAIHFGVTNSLGWEDLVSRRTFEIPAYGGFMLHVDNAEVRGLYDVPSEIDVFDTPVGLVEKVQYYLPRAKLRAQMVQCAKRRCVPAYGYVRRAEQLDTLVRELLNV